MSPNAQAFTLPVDGEVFTSEIMQRSEDLVDAGVWEGLEIVKLRAWMQNFTSELERYFAACVLDALIYRSDKQTVAMMEQMIERVVPDLLRGQPPTTELQKDWGDLLRRTKREPDPGIRLIPVIRTQDPPTKSGPLIARLYRRHLRLNDAWMVWPWQLKQVIQAGVKAVVFIDDFLGTGSQFTRFANHFSIRDELQQVYAVYAPLVAHRAGIQEVTSNFPGIKLCAVEVLENKYGLFSEDSMYFKDGINSPASAQQFYETLLEKRLPEVHEQYRTGFGGLQLAYAFEHSTPNNCLPILWLQSDTWNPLFER